MAPQSSWWMTFLFFLVVSLSTFQVTLSARSLLQASVPAGIPTTFPIPSTIPSIGNGGTGLPRVNLPPFPSIGSSTGAGNAGVGSGVGAAGGVGPGGVGSGGGGGSGLGSGLGGSFPNLPNFPTIPNLPTTMPSVANFIPTSFPPIPFLSSPPPSN